MHTCTIIFYVCTNQKNCSNLDGFHPNLKTYRFASRLLWRQLFLKKSDKLRNQDFDSDAPVYCPTADDRIQSE